MKHILRLFACGAFETLLVVLRTKIPTLALRYKGRAAQKSLDFAVHICHEACQILTCIGLSSFMVSASTYRSLYDGPSELLSF